MEKLSLKDKIQILVDFCEANNRLPRHIGKGEPESNLFNFMNKYKSINSTIIDLRVKYRKTKTAKENYTELAKFCKANKRLPRKNGEGSEPRLHGFMNKHRYDDNIAEIIDKYRSRHHLPKDEMISWEEGLKQFEEFCRINKRLPRSDRHKGELKLSNFKNRYKDKPEVMDIVRRYRFKSISKSYEESFKEFKLFLETNGRLPMVGNNRDETRLQGFMRRFRYKNEVNELVDKYRIYNNYRMNLKLLEEFIDINGRLPKHNLSDKSEFRLCIFMKRHEDYEDVHDILIKFNAI